MTLVKCYLCKEKYDKALMNVEEKETSKLNKDKTPKVTRKYFHPTCYEMYLNDKSFKEKEIQELDDLYKYLLKLHNVEVLDGRMMEKLQDLRNGSVKLGNKKIKRYKDGIDYSIILYTYQQEEQNVTWAIRNKHFQSKWNEFAYCFGIMLNKVNDVNAMDKLKQKHENKLPLDIDDDHHEIIVTNKPKKKKDDLDISSFL